jgi:5'-3' exonuclease
MKVHLIDGTYELFRAHFGAPSAKSPAGQEVGATRGLVRSMAALLRQEDVTHVGFAFDTTIESFRNELFAGYKTGEGMEPELFAQFPLAERAARALGMTTWSMEKFEADDALATAAIRYAKDPRVEEVLICSPDKDLAQVVHDNGIHTYDRMRERIYDRAAVVEKFGIDPESIPDYLGLVGDTADGIPGLARWGAKSTATVLAHYKCIENIPDDENEWDFKVRGAASLAKVLRENRDAALLYKQLATLRLDVPLAEELDAIRWQGPNTTALASLCDELGISAPRLS